MKNFILKKNFFNHRWGTVELSWLPNQEDFDRTVVGSEAPVLVDFYADWCAPCKYVAPLMDELAQTHEGTLLVVKVDTDQAPDVSQQFEIRSIPTVILFKSGAEVGRSVGFEPEKLRAMAEEAVRPG